VLQPGPTYTLTSGTGAVLPTVTWAAERQLQRGDAQPIHDRDEDQSDGDVHRAPASAAYQSAFTVASTTNSSASRRMREWGVLQRRPDPTR